jgi:hypothetical protein
VLRCQVFEIWQELCTVSHVKGVLNDIVNILVLQPVFTVLLSGCACPAAHCSFCVYVLYHEICRFVQFLCYCPLNVSDVDTLKSKYYWSAII